MGKVLETRVTSRLTHHLESKKFLSDRQYGFRKAHNAEQALWNIVSVATSALQSRQRAILVSLDLESAYDRVWHKGLLQKLGTLETPPELLGWIASFLDSRIAYMKVGSAEAIRHLGMGVPQGSPLSPIFFLVYIQDLLDRLNAVDRASAQAFADDVITWWVLSQGQLGESISDEIGHILVDSLVEKG